MTQAHGKRKLTLHDRRRRLLFGAIIGVFVLILYVPILGLLSLMDDRSPIFEPLLFIILVGLPIAGGLIGSRWLDRHDENRDS